MTVMYSNQEFIAPINVEGSAAQYQYFPYRPRPEQQIFMHKSAMQLQAREMQRGESKPHQCQQCLKSFSSNHQLVQHIRVHTGEKPYKCSYCERRFKQLSHVQQHTRLHTGERPYKCHFAECGRAFIQLSNLQQHLRNHDAQLERMKNRPFHCQICGKGFATESSLRTHTTKHAALIGGPNAVNCPMCHKMFLGGSALMEHMKHVHKDPNASGVAAKRRTPNHPCPICGKQYVNEGSLRKHMATHPEAAGLSSPLRMWPCSVCQAVFTHESAFLTHMDHMRMDPKHQFAAQYVLSRAAAERRERETLLAAAAAAASGGMGMGMGMGGPHMFSGMPSMSNMLAATTAAASAASPSALSDASSRISTPADASKLDPRVGAGFGGMSSLLATTMPSSVGMMGVGVSAASSMDVGGMSMSMSAGGGRLDMLNRLQYGSMGGGMTAGMQPIGGGGPSGMLPGMAGGSQRCMAPPLQQPGMPATSSASSLAAGDSMRAMIQQSQAELVKSTLCSQAESVRSLDMLRSLTGSSADGMMSQSPDLRMLQADLALRSSGHDPAAAAAAGGQPADQLGGHFRLQDTFRFHHDPRAAAFGFLNTAPHN